MSLDEPNRMYSTLVAAHVHCTRTVLQYFLLTIVYVRCGMCSRVTSTSI